MRLLCLQHSDHVPPANVAVWARERGHTLETVLVHRAEALPEVTQYDFVVVLGGPMDIYAEAEHPWLRSEKLWLRQLLDARVPVLGICLGSQLLADLLGGPVTVGGAREIGWWDVQLTAAGAASPVFDALPQRFQAFSWHSDTWQLPPGATLLAVSEGCESQAFEYGGFVYGVQFHPEFSHAGTETLTAGHGGVVRPGEWVQQPEQFLADPERFDRMRGDVLFALLDAIVDRHAPALGSQAGR